jgi:selenocysteine lyase/cysteine desulfurase
VTTLPVRWIVPALRRFGGESTVRASLKLYNTRGDIDALAASVDELVHTRRSSGPRRSER